MTAKYILQCSDGEYLQAAKTESWRKVQASRAAVVFRPGAPGEESGGHDR